MPTPRSSDIPHPDITREYYISKPAIAADVAHILQGLADED